MGEQICEKYDVEWSPNPQVIAHTGMTVNGDGNEPPYDGQSLPPYDGQSLPPPRAPGVGTSSGNNNRDDFNEPDFPLPKASANSNDSTAIGRSPLIPLAPPSVSDSNTTTSKRDTKNDNNKGLENNQPSSNGGKDSASYKIDHLAARFEKLKNL